MRDSQKLDFCPFGFVSDSVSVTDTHGATLLQGESVWMHGRAESSKTGSRTRSSGDAGYTLPGPQSSCAKTAVDSMSTSANRSGACAPDGSRSREAARCLNRIELIAAGSYKINLTTSIELPVVVRVDPSCEIMSDLTLPREITVNFPALRSIVISISSASNLNRPL